jgi:hypothetical protein
MNCYHFIASTTSILTKRGQFDDALKTLNRADLPNLQGVWKDNMLMSIEAVNQARRPQ